MESWHGDPTPPYAPSPLSLNIIIPLQVPLVGTTWTP